MRPITASRAEGQSIGELSRATGVNIETIRYYERMGLWAAPSRSEGGYRLYAPEHLKRLNFIRRARLLGFSIGEVRTLLRLADERIQGQQLHDLLVGQAAQAGDEALFAQLRAEEGVVVVPVVHVHARDLAEDLRRAVNDRIFDEAHEGG